MHISSNAAHQAKNECMAELTVQLPTTQQELAMMLAQAPIQQVMIPASHQ